MACILYLEEWPITPCAAQVFCLNHTHVWFYAHYQLSTHCTQSTQHHWADQQSTCPMHKVKASQTLATYSARLTQTSQTAVNEITVPCLAWYKSASPCHHHWGPHACKRPCHREPPGTAAVHTHHHSRGQLRSGSSQGKSAEACTCQQSTSPSIVSTTLQGPQTLSKGLTQ